MCYFSGFDICFCIFPYSNGQILLRNGPQIVKYSITYIVGKFSREIDITYKVAYGIKVIEMYVDIGSKNKQFDLNTLIYVLL